MRRKLVWWSLLGGVLITVLGLTLRFVGISAPVPYLTYSGSYLMQVFFQRFLEWIPWQYADNLISELFLFFALNVLGYGFVIFLLLRIFIPDRSGDLPPLTNQKSRTLSSARRAACPEPKRQANDKRFSYQELTAGRGELLAESGRKLS